MPYSIKRSVTSLGRAGFHEQFGRVASTIESDRLKAAVCLAWLLLRPALWSALGALLLGLWRR